MCQNKGKIRANLTSCYKIAIKIYNHSSDNKEFKKLQKILLLACENDIKEGFYVASLLKLSYEIDTIDFLTTRF